MLFFSSNKSRDTRQINKETKTRKQNKTKNKEGKNNEIKRERERERERERDRERETEKGGGKTREKQWETPSNKQQYLFWGEEGETSFFLHKQETITK